MAYSLQSNCLVALFEDRTFQTPVNAWDSEITVLMALVMKCVHFAASIQ